MGKSSKSSDKSKKNAKVAPTWRQKLAECDINTIQIGRTFELILLAELTITFFEAIPLFNVGAQCNRTNVVKSLNFETFINEVKQNKQSFEGKTTEDKPKKKEKKGKGQNDPLAGVFPAAATEAMEFLKTDQPISPELTAQLLKLKIINIICEDVALRDEERKIEMEKLVKPEEEKSDKGKKEKEKKKPQGKGKGKKASISLPVEERQLFIVLNGFYEPELVEELWKIGIPLCAVFELATPNSAFKELYSPTATSPKSSLSVLSETLNYDGEADEERVLYINQIYEKISRDSFNTIAAEQTEGFGDSIVLDKLYILHNFWSKIYPQLEGELQTKCLESTAHIRGHPQSALHFNKEAEDNAQALEVFSEISKEILKIPEVKRQHLNYLHNTRVWEVESKVKEIPATSLKTYKNLIELVPPECFTIALFLHCLLEEVSTRVVDPKPPEALPPQNLTESNSETSINPHKETKLSSSPTFGPEENALFALQEEDLYEKQLKELADYVLKYRTTNSPLCKTGLTYHKDYKFDPRMNFVISKEPFTIHETNSLEFKINPYQQLKQELLEINLNALKKCSATFLWQQYPRLRTIELIYRNHQLQSWSKLLDLSLNEVNYALGAIEFDNLVCANSSGSVKRTRGALQLLCPEKNNSQVLKVAQPRVKYIQTPDISLTTLVKREGVLGIPKVVYSDHPNVYESKNISAYFWYEKLSPVDLLQQLQRANVNYICLDHKFCPYSDAILLRYHNDLDMFGINSRIWTQSLRTPVCFRDFCKYVIHDEAQWLEREEDNYQEKLRQARKLNSDSPQAEAPPEANENQEKIQNSLTKYCAKPEEPFSFLAYDFTEARLQLTGTTTTFHSMDGYKVTVDRTTFLGKPPNLSLNIATADHNLFLHYNEVTAKDPLMFHFALADGTIIVFSKPPKFGKPDVSIAERIYKSTKNRRTLNPESAYSPRENTKNFYYVTEKQRCYLKSVKVPFVARQNFLVPHDFMLSFLEQLKRVSSSRMSKEQGKLCELQTLRVSLEKPKNSKEVVTLYTSSAVQQGTNLNVDNQLEVYKMDLTISSSDGAESDCKDILKKIKRAKKLQIPMFKVYSSKLHKFEYIKRTKSHILVKIGKHNICLTCKHPRYKTSRDLEIVKVFPIKLSNDFFYNNNNCYDMKISLPSGLLIHTLPGINDTPFTVKQRYIEKGPMYRNIAEEDSRTFLRNGRVVVKKNDGSLTIFSANGQIIHCEVPYLKVQTRTKYNKREKLEVPSFKHKILRGTKSESRLKRIVNWRRKHLIRGPESRYYTYRRVHLRAQKLQTKKNNRNQIYILQDSTSSFEYTLITHDGKQLKVTEASIKNEGQLFQTTHEDKHFKEYLRVRDDGTTSLYYGDGVITTKFSDQTRISSWFTEAPETISIENDELGETETYDSLNDYDYFEEWVFVNIFYKFEHPSYATILYNSDNFETEIDCPNEIVVEVTEDGYYFLDIDRAVSSVVNDELVYLESRSCETCMQRSITTLNIKPLYEQQYPIAGDTELLKTCDSYEKVFIVNYSGKCFRNSNYINHRANRVECHEHDREEYQQLFILNRDLSGSKLWDVRAYKKRSLEATDNNNTVLQYYGRNANANDYNSLEFRTYKYTPYHEYFVNKPFPKLTLPTYQTQAPPRSLAYSTFCHLFRMPKKHTIEFLQASMVQNEESEFPNTDDPVKLCRCVSQIAREEKKSTLQLHSDSQQSHHQAGELSSALSLCERWYAWHEDNQPYVPPTHDQRCKCELDEKPIETRRKKSLPVFKDSWDMQPSTVEESGIQTSLEIISRKVSSDSFIELYRKPTAVCKCQVPAYFSCPHKDSISYLVKEEPPVEEEEGEEEKEEEIVYDMEAGKRISSIKRWSYENNFLDNLYVLTEESLSFSDFKGKTISDMAIKEKKPPPCKCNVKTQLSQEKVATKPKKRNVCTESSCKTLLLEESFGEEEEIYSITSSSRASVAEGDGKRQAGGEDAPQAFLNIKESNTVAQTQRRYLLRELQRKIIDLALRTNGKTEKSEHYKISVANEVICRVFEENLNSLELSEVLRRLKDGDKNIFSEILTEELPRLVFSTSEVVFENQNPTSLESKSKLIGKNQGLPGSKGDVGEFRKRSKVATENRQPNQTSVAKVAKNLQLQTCSGKNNTKNVKRMTIKKHKKN